MTKNKRAVIARSAIDEAIGWCLPVGLKGVNDLIFMGENNPIAPQGLVPQG